MDTEFVLHDSITIKEPFEEASAKYQAGTHSFQTREEFDWHMDNLNDVPLYEGCRVSVLQAHTALLHWYAAHGTLSQSDLDCLFELVEHFDPT